MLTQWRHVPALNGHNGTKIDRKDEQGQETLDQHITHNPLSLEKVQYIETTGRVVYRSEISRGRNRKNVKRPYAEDFIAAKTQHTLD